MVFSAAMRRRGPEKEEEACGVWLDAAALKRRKTQVGRCRGERGRSLKKAEEWDLGRVERRKWGRKADRQAVWGGM